MVVNNQATCFSARLASSRLEQKFCMTTTQLCSMLAILALTDAVVEQAGSLAGKTDRVILLRSTPMCDLPKVPAEQNSDVRH